MVCQETPSFEIQEGKHLMSEEIESWCVQDSQKKAMEC